MKITLESTGILLMRDGIKARVWIGTTEQGVECTAIIPMLAVPGIDISNVAIGDLFFPGLSGTSWCVIQVKP